MTRGARGGWSAVLFDLDGTLADTVELILRCFRHTLQVHRGEAPPDDAWLSGIGTPLRDQLRAFTDDPDEVERMAATYRDFQGSIHDENVAPYDGAVAMVTELGARGVPVAVVTSKSRGMAERTLARCGFGGLYQVLVGADDVTRGKPHPEPVFLALDRLGLSAGDGPVLFLGDSPFDLRAGRAAGVRTAAALWGPFPRGVLEAEAPDFFLDEPRGLLELTP